MGNAAHRRFAFSSRGERVDGELWLPPSGAASAPLVLVPRSGEGGFREDLAAAVPGWTARGAAVASFDLPLCGSRRSPKLSELLQAGLSGPRAAASGTLVQEFARQSAAELAAALAELARQPELAADRSAAVAFALAAPIASLWCAGEPRLRALALGPCTPHPGLAPLEVERALLRFAPRPILRVGEPLGRAAGAIIDFLSPRLRDSDT